LLVEQLQSWGLSPDASHSAVLGSANLRELLQRVLDSVEGPIAIWGPELDPAGDSAPAVPGAEPAPEAEPSPLPAAPVNRWNAFQRRMAGSGLSQADILAAYREEVAATAGTGAAGSTAAAVPSATPPPATQVLPLGHTVLRTPPEQRRFLGVHHCSWSELLFKFGVPPSAWAARRGSYYVPKFESLDKSERQWRDQGLSLPIPVFEGPRTVARPPC